MDTAQTIRSVFNLLNSNRKEKWKMEMYEVCWQEIARSGKIVTKRKAFKNERKFNRFIEKLFENPSFLKILAFR